MNYRAVTYGKKWIKEIKKKMHVASVFNGKEKVKTKNAQHKLGERKRKDDEMKFN